MTVRYPDVSQFQDGVSLKDADAVVARATEGNWLTDPLYAAYKKDAAGRGIPFAAYHFLESGSSSRSQARHCFKVVGKGTPLMLDFEPIPAASASGNLGTGRTTGSAAVDVPAGPDGRASTLNASYASKPGISKAAAFIDHYRSAGGTVHLLYFPHWYWEVLGSPSLKRFMRRGMVLVSSDYTVYSGTGPGWAEYGGMTPLIWQYTSSQQFNGQAVDFNAFKGTVPQLRNVFAYGTLEPGTKVVLTYQIMDGKESLREVTTRHPHNAISTVIRLAVQESPTGQFTGGIGVYVNHGDWDAPMPAGAKVWFYKEVPI